MNCFGWTFGRIAEITTLISTLSLILQLDNEIARLKPKTFYISKQN